MRNVSASHVGSLFTLSVAACIAAPTGTTTPPTLAEVLAHRAIWAAVGPRLYSYVITWHGGNGVFDGRPMQLVVRNDTVEEVTFFNTHQLVPGPYTFWPTIDGLFDEAVSAARGGLLTAIAFDPQFGYPTQIGFVPRPDQASSIEATLGYTQQVR